MSEETELERIYTVPLSRAWIAPRHRRTKRAVNILREFAAKHMKTEEIKIDTELNERLWNRGITQPPRRITVKMSKDEDGVVTISLPKEKAEEATPQGLEEEKQPSVEPEKTPATSSQEVQEKSVEETSKTKEEKPKTRRKTRSKKRE